VNWPHVIHIPERFFAISCVLVSTSELFYFYLVHKGIERLSRQGYHKSSSEFPPCLILVLLLKEKNQDHCLKILVW
jgi:hypothetical protein